MDWLWIGVTISCLHREVHARVSDLFIELEKQVILLNIFMKLKNKIAEDINERNKPYLMLHGLNLVLKSVVQQNLFFSGQ